MSDPMFNKTSIFTEQQISQWIREEHPKFVKFIKLYYEWLERNGGETNVSRNLLTYQDSDLTPDLFFEFLRKEFMHDVPIALKTDKRTLLKNMQDFFRSRGSEKSFELLFRILYNEEVEFYYPKKDILRASDGKWIVDKMVIVVPISGIGSALFSYLGKDIVGFTSKARGRVERITATLVDGVQEFRMYMSNVIGEFVQELVSDINGVPIGTIEDYVIFPGYYQGTDGFLSSNKKLQDNYYYQEYSYEVRSGQPVSKYKGIVDGLVHPAGTIMFGQIYMTRIIDMPLGQYSRDKVTLEIMFVNESGLIKEVGTGVNYNDFTDLSDVFYEFSLYHIIGLSRQTTSYVDYAETVNISDGSITELGEYTTEELQNVTVEDAVTNRLVLADKLNHPSFSSRTAAGNRILYVDALNTNTILFADTVKSVSSNVAICNQYPWHGTRTMNNDKVAMANYDSVENS